MRLLLVIPLAVALPTGYHRKPSADFEDKLDLDAERMDRTKTRQEFDAEVMEFRSTIAEAVAVLRARDLNHARFKVSKGFLQSELRKRSTDLQHLSLIHI